MSSDPHMHLKITAAPSPFTAHLQLICLFVVLRGHFSGKVSISLKPELTNYLFFFFFKVPNRPAKYTEVRTGGNQNSLFLDYIDVCKQTYIVMGLKYKHLVELVQESLPHLATIFHQFAIMVSSVTWFWSVIAPSSFTGTYWTSVTQHQ